MWNKSRKGESPHAIDIWMKDTERGLDQFNQLLYKAFKEEFVRYPDVRIDLPTDKDEDDVEETTAMSVAGNSRRRRHRKKSKSRTTDKKEKLWTASSAIFFAATTMATIGARLVSRLP